MKRTLPSCSSSSPVAHPAPATHSVLWLAPNGSEDFVQPRRLAAKSRSLEQGFGVGAGGSQEAALDLKAGVPAGTYHCVLDAVIIRPVDVTFDLIWRRGTTDMPLVSWTEHYDPAANGGFDAQPFEYDEPASAIDFQAGDQLVFRYSGANTTMTSETYIPNGDGALSNGRMPNITLPK